MEELKACPFCGCDKVKMFYDERQNYHVECYGCGKTVSFHIAKDSSWKKAIENYNRRAAPENKALTLEQLRKMDEEPVWIRDLLIPTCSTWHWICEDPVHGLVAVKPLNVDGYFDIEHGHNYGQTWFAYARKPEGSEKP